MTSTGTRSLAGQLVDLGAVASAPGHADLLERRSPLRRSSRATRPQGHSQFVGVRQRYRRACAAIGSRVYARRLAAMVRRGRHRYDALPARASCVEAHGHRTSSRCTSTGTAAPTARSTCRTSTSYYAHLRTAKELPTTSQPSVGDFLAVYEPHHRGRPTTSSRSTSPAASRGPSARPSRRATHLVERGRRPGAHLVVDSKTTCAGLGVPGDGGRQRRPRRGRASSAGRRRARARACAVDEALVRGRHARVPAPRRPHRRRPGVARLGAAGQADPDDRRRDRADRARAHRRAGGRAADRVPARAQGRGLRPLRRSSTSRIPSAPPSSSSAAARSSTASRCSSPRSGRSSARTSARACSASPGSRARCSARTSPPDPYVNHRARDGGLSRQRARTGRRPLARSCASSLVVVGVASPCT